MGGHIVHLIYYVYLKCYVISNERDHVDYITIRQRTVQTHLNKLLRNTRSGSISVNHIIQWKSIVINVSLSTACNELFIYKYIEHVRFMHRSIVKSCIISRAY